MGLWQLKPSWLWRLTGYRPHHVATGQWEREYASGDWSRLEGLPDLSHYSVIVGYLDYLKSAAILDLGCGHGILAGRIKALAYRRYLGVDLSTQAIGQASACHGDARTHFVVGDAETFQIGPGFTAVVFNESLYYFRDPCRTLGSIGRAMAPGGRMVISMFGDGRSKALWPMLDTVARTEDAVTLRHFRGAEWTIKLMVPRP